MYPIYTSSRKVIDVNRALEFILIALMLVSLVAPLPISIIIPVHSTAVPTTIVITQDNITKTAYYRGGTGSETNPWVLVFGTINLGGGFIELTNFTGGYLVIKNSNISNGGWVSLWIHHNVTGLHLVIKNTTIEGLTGTGYLLYINDVANSTATIEDSKIINGTSNNWWDAAVCLNKVAGSTIRFVYSTIGVAGHGIRITSTKNTTIVLNNVMLMGITDKVGWGTNWRGLIRIDGNNDNLNITILHTVFSAKGSAGAPSAVEVESSVAKLMIMDTVFENTTPGFYYGVYVKSGTIENMTLMDITIKPNAIQHHFVRIESKQSFDNHILINIKAESVHGDLYHIASKAAGVSGGKVCLKNIYAEKIRYLVGLSPTLALTLLRISNATITDSSAVLSSGGNLTFSCISITNVKAENISDYISITGKLMIDMFTMKNIYLKTISDKIIKIPCSNNEIKSLVISNLTAIKYKDCMDIRGVEHGVFYKIRLVNNDFNDDGWADGNGIYLYNVNNTLIKDIYFEDAGWKNIVLDGIHYNITIVGFVDKEKTKSNGQNMLVAIGPWSNANVHNLTIADGVVYNEDLLTVYDTSDALDGLHIFNVTVYGSSPAGWEHGRCGTTVYLNSGENIVIENLTSIKPQIYGIYINKVSNAEVVYNNITLAGSYGVYITSLARNVYVHNSTFWYCGKSPQAYSDSTSVKAEYNLYTDYTGKDLNGDGIGDTPYKWAGHGGIEDKKPIYYGTYFAVMVITDETAPKLAVGGQGTRESPYIIKVDVANVSPKFFFGVYIGNLTKCYVVVEGVIEGEPSRALLYVSPTVKTHVIIKNLKLVGSKGDGIMVEGAHDTVTIGPGVAISETTKHGIDILCSSSIVVDGVTFSSIGWSGVYIDNSSNIMVDNIKATKPGHYAVRVTDHSTMVTLKNIYVSTTGWDGVLVENATYVKILGLSVNAPSYKGLYLKHSMHICVEGLRVQYSHDSPVLSENCSYVTIKAFELGPAISGNMWPGIQFKSYNKNIRVTDGYIHDLTGSDVAYGIAVWNGGYNITFENIKFSHVTMAIEIDGVKKCIMRNLLIESITKTKGWNGIGINLKNSVDVVLSNITIIGAQNHGIQFLNTNRTFIENLVIKQPGSVGIRFDRDSSYDTIKNVKIEEPGWGILTVDNVAHIILENIFVINASDYGIDLYSGHDILIENCTVLHSFYSGIIVHKNVYNVLIEYSIIGYNGKDTTKPQHMYGIAIEQNTHNVTVTKNLFVKNLHTPQAWLNTSDPTVKIIMNYWSDYSGADKNHDGIGDTPYKLASPIKPAPEDTKPLMKPSTPYQLRFAQKHHVYPLPGTITHTTTTTTITTTTTPPATTTTTSPSTTTTPTTTSPTSNTAAIVAGVIIIITIIIIAAYLLRAKKK